MGHMAATDTLFDVSHAQQHDGHCQWANRPRLTLFSMCHMRGSAMDTVGGLSAATDTSPLLYYRPAHQCLWDVFVGLIWSFGWVLRYLYFGCWFDLDIYIFIYDI